MSRAHLIEEATFDVSFDAPRAARRQEPLLPAFIRDRLLPLADEVFGELSDTDGLLKLDRLELDLGDIPYRGFQDEIERRFKAILASALKDKKLAIVTPEAAGGEHPGVSPASAQLTLFLETGVLTGEAARSDDAAIDRLLASALQHDGAGFVQFLKTTRAKPAIVQRLARQFQQSHLAAIVDLLAAGSGKRLAALTENFVIEPRGELHAEEIKTLLWEQLLTAYLEPGARLPDPEQLFAKIVEGLAAQRHRLHASRAANQAAQQPIDAPIETVADSAGSEVIERPLSRRPQGEASPESSVAEDRYFQSIARRLRGQTVSDITGIVEVAMRDAPASLGLLFQQWQSGTLRGGLELLHEGEARQLLLAFVELRHGGPGSPFATAIETQASQARSAAQYYRYILDQLLRERDIDLEAAVAIAAEQATISAESTHYRQGSADYAEIVPSPHQPIDFPSLLDRAMTQGHADELAGIWKKLRRRDAGQIRTVLARHMGQESTVRRTAANFPEFILQDLAALMGSLTAHELAFVAALSRQPALRRELDKERNSRYWAYALSRLHSQAVQAFDRAGYLRGLVQCFADAGAGAEVESLMQIVREVGDNADNIDALHDRLLAQVLLASPRLTDSIAEHNAASASASASAPPAQVPASPQSAISADVAEAQRQVLLRLKGKTGQDLRAPLATLVQKAPASLEALLRQWQAEGIAADAKSLDAAELKQLLYALAALRLDEKGERLLQTIEARSTRVPDAADTARQYRVLLKRMLQNRTQEAPTAATESDAASRADESRERIVAHLLGQKDASGSFAGLVEATLRDSPATLTRLFEQWQSNKIQLPVEHLDADQAHQLLNAFVRLRQSEQAAGLLQSMATQALRAPDSGTYYRDALRRLLRAGRLDIDAGSDGDERMEDENGMHAGAIAGLPRSVQEIDAPADASVTADQDYRQLVSRLQGQGGDSIADTITRMASAAPEGLGKLFRQMRAGAIRSDMTALDAAETRQLLGAYVRLRLGANSTLLRVIEMRAPRTSALAAYYRDVLQRLLRNENPDVPGPVKEESGNIPRANDADAVSVPPQLLQEQTAATDIAASASSGEHFGKLVLRLQGRHAVSLVDTIALMASTAPASLERLFGQLQSGDIAHDMAALDAAELRQLLGAFVRLRLSASGTLLRVIESRAASLGDSAAYYRGVLQRLLRNESPAGKDTPAGPGSSAPAAEDGAASPDKLYKQLVLRLQGERTAPLTALIDHMGTSEPAVMDSLFRQMQSGEIQADMAVMDAAEIRQLLLAFLRLRHGADGARLRTIDAGAAQAQDIAQHYRSQLQQLLQNGKGDPQATKTVAKAGLAGGEQDAHAASADAGFEDIRNSLARIEAGPASTKRPAANDPGQQGLPASEGKRMDAAVRQIEQRLRGAAGQSIAGLVRSLLHAPPQGTQHLETLFRQLQSGSIGSGVAHLEADEARQLLHAFILLRRQANGGGFVRAIESHAGQAHDAGNYYRHLLQRLLHGEDLDLEAAAAAADPAGSGESNPVASARRGKDDVDNMDNADDVDHGDDRAAEHVYRQLLQRLSGQPGPDLAQALAAVAWNAANNAAILETLFQHLRQHTQDAQLWRNVDALATDEIRQLLYAFVRSHANTAKSAAESEALLVSIDAGAEQATDVGRYYRYLLKQAILHGLAAGPAQRAATTPSQSEKHIAETEPGSSSANDPPAQGRRPADTQHEAASARQPNDILLANAGVVLAWPFLPQLFEKLNLADKMKFANAHAAERAAHLIQFAVDAHCDTVEFKMALNKLLCGIALDVPIVREIKPTPMETETVEGMLQAIIGNWRAIGNTSIAGLRESFLQRNGILRWREDGWRLHVERKTIDVLVDRLPWGMSIIKLPWMAQPIHVEWR